MRSPIEPVKNIARSLRAFRCPELALYHSLGKLPEPKLTHEFS
jgi:hypothetical protein